MAAVGYLSRSKGYCDFHTESVKADFLPVYTFLFFLKVAAPVSSFLTAVYKSPVAITKVTQSLLKSIFMYFPGLLL